MFEYLTSKEYRDAKNAYSKSKSNINKLKKIKTDLTDDSRSISNINGKINDIYDRFHKMVNDSGTRSRTKGKLEALKEPYQTSDGNLINAVDCIDREIGNQNSKMSNANNTMNNIKKSSGGGAW